MKKDHASLRNSAILHNLNRLGAIHKVRTQNF